VKNGGTAVGRYGGRCNAAVIARRCCADALPQRPGALSTGLLRGLRPLAMTTPLPPFRRSAVPPVRRV